MDDHDDLHAEADALFGPCWVVGCSGSVWALWEVDRARPLEDPPEGEPDWRG